MALPFSFDYASAEAALASLRMTAGRWSIAGG
jgi:hypothetical protein